MAKAPRILAVTTALGLAMSAWLYRQNRSLEAALATRPVGGDAAPADGAAGTTRTGDPWTLPAPRAAALPAGPAIAPPALPEAPQETRLDRRARRTREFAAMFGRHDGETEDEYRARIGPMITAGLALPRMRAAEYRRIAEQKANVTPAQAAKLDQAFEQVYGDVLDYTNKAIADGTLSPYERNVAGWLDYAGGLGGMLTEAQGQIGTILSPEQIQTMAGAGFEWGEYLGLSAPWEQLQPPPPPKD